MTINSREAASIQQRLDRLETSVSEGFGDQALDEHSAPKSGRPKSAIWPGPGTLPIYSLMKFVPTSAEVDETSARRAAKMHELSYPLVDDDDKLICITLNAAEPGDQVQVTIDGEILFRFKSRSNLSDFDDDPTKVLKYGDPLFIYNDVDDPVGSIIERGKVINKTTHEDDEDIQKFISTGSVAQALETQQPRADGTILVRGLLRPRGVNELVFFDDFVQIKEDAPDTNFFGSSIRTILDDLALGNVTKQHQLFLKAERPFNRIRKLVLPIPGVLPTIPGIQQTADWADFGVSGGIGTFMSFVEVTLLKVPLDVGADPENPFALDKLTWNNSFFRTTHMIFGNSTLYSDPDNFEGFNPPRIGGSNFNVTVPKDGDLSGTTHNYETLTMYFEDTIGNNRIRANNGLFFGIHIFFNLAGTGGWVTPIDRTTTAASVSATVSEIGKQTGKARAYIMLDDLGAVTE